MDENNLENRGNIITGIPREHESPNKIKQSRISRKKNSREFFLISKNYQLPDQTIIRAKRKSIESKYINGVHKFARPSANLPRKRSAWNRFTKIRPRYLIRFQRWVFRIPKPKQCSDIHGGTKTRRWPRHPYIYRQA